MICGPKPFQSQTALRSALKLRFGLILGLRGAIAQPLSSLRGGFKNESQFSPQRLADRRCLRGFRRRSRSHTPLAGRRADCLRLVLLFSGDKPAGEQIHAVSRQAVHREDGRAGMSAPICQRMISSSAWETISILVSTTKSAWVSIGPSCSGGAAADGAVRARTPAIISLVAGEQRWQSPAVSKRSVGRFCASAHCQSSGRLETRK